MVGAQLYDDQQFHTTVWSLDDQGVGTRLACAPENQRTQWVDGQVAIAPDAIYAISVNFGDSTSEIDRIAR